MKNILFGSITVLISLLTALLLAELLVRATWVPPSTLSTQATEQHPVYGWAPRPRISGRQVSAEFDYGFSHTSQGLRGSTVFSASVPAGIENRILFLGDSFTYGNGSNNDEIFVELINARMPNTEVINTGANGYGQRQQLAILDTLGEALKPDLVVLMFFWNDLEDNIKKSSPNFQVGEDGRVMRTDIQVPDDFDPLVERTDNYTPKSHERPLRRTYLYKLFKEGARGFRHRLFGSKKRIIQDTEQKENAWKATADFLRLIQLRSAEIGTELIVVSIPDYQLIDPSEGHLKGQKRINIEIEDALREVCDEFRIDYLDLLPELRIRRANTDSPLYYAIDRHWTPDGNAAVANILLPVISERFNQQAGRPFATDELAF